MPKFKTELIASLIVNEVWQACFGFGYFTDQILADWTLNIQIYNCVKQILDNFFDWSGNWTGADAKILDECSFSDSRNDVQIWQNDFLQKSENDIALYGTFNPKSLLCTQALATGMETPVHIRKFVKAAYKTLGDYALGDQNPLAESVVA